VQFVENRFVESYYPTIENTFSRTIKHKGQEYLCEIIDTAGQVSFCAFSVILFFRAVAAAVGG
jgi:Ras family protein